MALILPTPAGHSLEAVARLRDGADGVVLCHPHPAFGGRMDTPLLMALEAACFAAGWSTLRFNFRGLGASTGTATGGRAEHEDALAAAVWMRERSPRVFLVGNSFGAIMALGAVAEGADVAAYVAAAFPTHIVGTDPQRLDLVRRALARAVPSLFIGGDADQFADIAQLEEWIAHSPAARLVLRRGQDHFFDGEAEDWLVRGVVDFLRAV